MDLAVAYRDTGAARPPVARSRTKRSMDVLVSGALLVAFSWLFVLIAMAIVIDSGWPPLYSQLRTGFEGRTFRIWKFRTMVKDAEKRRDELLALNEAPFPAFKIHDDPRVTRLGRFLRKASADELPQLWNVLVGDMSLVGPRPLPTFESDLLDSAGRQRLRARPGITCSWQIGNRHSEQTGFGDWLAQDTAYIDTWSLGRDLAILARTAAVVVRMTGR